MSSNLSRAPCLLRSRLYTTIRLSYRGKLAIPQLSRALPSPRLISTVLPKALKMTSPSLEWRESSPERTIQRQIADGVIEIWGWVVYRTAYQPGLDAARATLQRLVLEDLRECVAESNALEIADRMDWAFVADPELEGASLDELKRRFRAWARAAPPCDLDAYKSGTSRCSRYDLFVQADEEALRSVVPDPGSYNAALLSGAHVNLVRAWVDPLPEEKATDANGESVDNEDWIRSIWAWAPPDGLCMP
ncbi:unnamed protein product [Clonostachys rhizophaga]|uniref:Uncharacterized protein n=1 Tax=Clonostachys rhizophaga TaxID=160324 RepID=A0A9N9VNN8_9HYPO|nr:unnamed protein product [Clonostachys rhizophaga]